MDNLSQNIDEINDPDKQPLEQSSIFSDISTDTSAYEKNLKVARVWLYIIGVVQIGMGVYEYSLYPNYSEEVRWLIFGIDAVLGLMFLGLAILSYKKPVVAFTSALILYVVVSLWSLYATGFTLSFQWIIKFLIIVALVRAIKDAREYAALKKGLDI